MRCVCVCVCVCVAGVKGGKYLASWQETIMIMEKVQTLFHLVPINVSQMCYSSELSDILVSTFSVWKADYFFFS